MPVLTFACNPSAHAEPFITFAVTEGNYSQSCRRLADECTNRGDSADDSNHRGSSTSSVPSLVISHSRHPSSKGRLGTGSIA